MSEPDPDLHARAQDSAREYAWQWFQYHAGQRQTVFRFYLVMIGVVSTGYVTSMTVTDLRSVSFLFGLLLIVISILFWLLDERSVTLIKLAEDYLKKEEERLKLILGHPEIRITYRADKERDTRFFMVWMYSFRRIYRIIFVLISMIGLSIILYEGKNPILNWIRCIFESDSIS